MNRYINDAKDGLSIGDNACWIHVCSRQSTSVEGRIARYGAWALDKYYPCICKSFFLNKKQIVWFYGLILLCSDHQLVSPTHVAIFRVVSARVQIYFYF